MNTEQLYQERLNRYITAMRNEKPDMIPIRPFVAEFTAKYAGYTCQEVAHDYNKAFEAAIKTAKDFGWEAVVPNMVYVWTGLAQAVGLRYYGIPGIGIPHTTGFNYIEPPEDQALMRADEYDALIADPTALPLQRLAAARFHRGQQDRPAFHLSEQPLLREGRHGDALLLLRLRPPDRAASLPSAARPPPSRASSRRPSTSSPTSCAAMSA